MNAPGRWLDDYDIDTLSGAEVSSRAAIGSLSLTGNLVVRTAGYAAAGDGGHGVYVLIADPGSTNRRYVRSADGNWYSLLTPNGANAKQFGARGDGSTVADDMTAERDALQQMLDSGITHLTIPAGTYRINGSLSMLTPNVTLAGAGRRATTIYANSSFSSDVLMVQSDYCTVRDLQIVAEEYASFGTYTSKPNALLKFQNANAALENVGGRVLNVHTSGGNHGVWFTNGRDVTLTNVSSFRPYQHGIALTGGMRNVLATGLDVDSSGVDEGIRIGSPNDDFVTRNVVIDGFNVRDCGVLDPTRANWQNNIGSHSNCLSDVVLANGTISGGGPALEWKLNTDSPPPAGEVAHYHDVLTANVHVRTGWADKGSATFLTTGTGAISSNELVGRVKFRNCSFTHTGAETPSSTNNMAVSLSAGKHNEASDCTIVGYYVGIGIFGEATYDNINALVQGNRIDATAFGIRVANYNVSGLRIVDNNIRAPEGVLVSTNTGVSDFYFAHNHVVATAAGTSSSALDVRGITSGLIERNYLEADLRVIDNQAQASYPTVSVMVRENHIVARAGTGPCYALVVREGAWAYEANRVNITYGVTGRSWLVSGGGSVASYRTLRGTRPNSAPTGGGAVGDIYGNNAIPAAGVPEWVCTSASDSAATWKAAAAVAA